MQTIGPSVSTGFVPVQMVLIRFLCSLVFVLFQTAQLTGSPVFRLNQRAQSDFKNNGLLTWQKHLRQDSTIFLSIGCYPYFPSNASIPNPNLSCMPTHPTHHPHLSNIHLILFLVLYRPTYNINIIKHCKSCSCGANFPLSLKDTFWSQITHKALHNFIHHT